MDAGDWTVIAAIVTAAGGLAGGFLTRRSAKETNAVGGFVSLTTALEHRVDRLEAAEQRRSELARAHRPWDVQLYDQAKAAGWSVTPPPPLD